MMSDVTAVYSKLSFRDVNNRLYLLVVTAELQLSTAEVERDRLVSDLAV